MFCSYATHSTLTVPLSLHPGTQMGTGELSGKPEEMLGGGGEDYLSIDWHPI